MSPLVGVVLPDCLTSPAMKESKAYKTYLGYTTGEVPPRSRNSERSPSKKDSVPVQADEEPVQKGKKSKGTEKEKVAVAHGKGMLNRQCDQEGREFDQENESKDDEMKSDKEQGMDDTTDQFDDDADARLEEPTENWHKFSTRSFGNVCSNQDEPVVRVADSDMPHDHEGNLGDNEDEPRKKTALEYGLCIEDMVLNIWSPVKVAYDKYALWGISHWREICKSLLALLWLEVCHQGAYVFNKAYLAVTHVSIMRKYGYGYLEEIVVRRADNVLYRFKEGDFPRLRINNIEDMLILVVQNRLSNLLGDDVADFAIALRMVLPEKRHPYTPYKDPQGFIYVDDNGRNRLMRSDELYKFSDGTLTRLLSSLEDITKNIDMIRTCRREDGAHGKERRNNADEIELYTGTNQQEVLVMEVLVLTEDVDLYDRMGRMEICQEATERMEYMQEQTTHLVMLSRSMTNIISSATTTAVSAAAG
ncbi:hypothetical protein Tco_1482711 [Tanacetum coccineum]